MLDISALVALLMIAMAIVIITTATTDVDVQFVIGGHRKAVLCLLPPGISIIICVWQSLSHWLPGD